MRKQYSGPFQAKLTCNWMTPALQLLELLTSTLKNACLWNMQNTPTLSSLNHNVPSPLPASWSGSNLHICTSFQVSISLSLSLSFSLSLSLSLLFSVQCSFIARWRTSRLKTSQPELFHNWHKPRTLFFFFLWEHFQLQSEMFLLAWNECNLKNT